MEDFFFVLVKTCGRLNMEHLMDKGAWVIPTRHGHIFMSGLQASDKWNLRFFKKKKNLVNNGERENRAHPFLNFG